MSDDASFAILVDRLRQGDERAADTVFRRFSARLLGLARSRLTAQLRQKVDPEDVTQSVFRSFFTRYSCGEYELKNWDGLWSLLVVMTLHKCGHQIDRFSAARRAISREAMSCQHVCVTDWRVIARDPSPSEAAALTELIAGLMQSLNYREQQILSMRLQGYTVSEISTDVGRSERTVQRLLERVRLQLLDI